MVGGQMRYPNQHRFSYPTNAPMVMIGGGPNATPTPSGQAMVFTTQMANDAAVEYSRQRTSLYQFHNNHPAVIDFIQHQYNPNRLISLQKPYEQLTQKQLENRKSKMAKLEQIQSTLSKTKSQSAVSSSSNSSQTSTSSTTTTTPSTAPVMPDMNSRPLSSNQMPTTGPMAMSATMGSESSVGIDSSNQEMNNHINTLSSINNTNATLLPDNGSTPMHSTLSGNIQVLCKCFIKCYQQQSIPLLCCPHNWESILHDFPISYICIFYGLSKLITSFAC